MKTKSQMLAEAISEKNVVVQAILAKGAEATDDEYKTATDTLAEIEKLDAERVAAAEFEAKAANIAATAASFKQSAAPIVHATKDAKPDGRLEIVYNRGQLKSFKGDGAHERAHAFGMWFLASIGNEAGNKFCKDHGIELKAHNEGTNTAGGYLVPHQFENDLIDLREVYGVFRRNAKFVPMSSDTRSDPRRTGGLTAYFVAESAAITESQKSWDRVQLTAKKLAALARITSELSEDASISVADDLANEIAYAFSVKEDLCGFVGDGTSTYGGMVGVTNALLNLSATRANIAGLVVGTGNQWTELVLADFNHVKARLPQYAYMRRPKWYTSQSFYYDVMEKLAVAAGGVTEAGIQGVSQVPRFLGYPVEITQAMPLVEANDQVCALFGALDMAASFGDRRATTIALSEHSRFATDEIEIRGTERFDINVHDVGNAHATAASRVPGPIVGLLMAAS